MTPATPLSVTCRFITITCMLWAFASDAQFDAQAQEPTSPRFERDIIYGKAGDEDLKLNLALPAKSTHPAPAIVVIHGGGWAAGDRTNHDDLAKAFAERGYVSATISYRLAPKHLFPAQVEDAKCAVRFLRAHAEKYGLDPDRIGAVGMSAGAHLSMMLGFMDADDGLEGEGGWKDQSSKVRAVVSFVGPTNLEADDLPEVSQQILRRFIGGTKSEKPEQYRKASPIQYVDSEDPPILMFQGMADPLIPNTQAYKMAEALSSAGVEGRIELLPGKGHGWPQPELDRTLETMFEFFETILKM